MITVRTMRTAPVSPRRHDVTQISADSRPGFIPRSIRRRVLSGIAAALLASSALPGCSYQNNESLPAPTDGAPAAAAAPVESTSGNFTLQQSARGTPANAAVSSNDQFTLIPEGAAP